jgi:hypothetical protein
MLTKSIKEPLHQRSSTTSILAMKTGHFAAALKWYPGFHQRHEQRLILLETGYTDLSECLNDFMSVISSAPSPKLW